MNLSTARWINRNHAEIMDMERICDLYPNSSPPDSGCLAGLIDLYLRTPEVGDFKAFVDWLEAMAKVAAEFKPDGTRYT